MLLTSRHALSSALPGDTAKYPPIWRWFQRWAYWFLPWDNEESVTPESAGVKASQRAA
jgi:hypothetical protein